MALGSVVSSSFLARPFSAPGLAKLGVTFFGLFLTPMQPLSERILSHARKTGMQLGVGIVTDEDRTLALGMSERRFALVDFTYRNKTGRLCLHEAGHTYALPQAVAHAATKRELVAKQRRIGRHRASSARRRFSLKSR